MPRIKGVPTDPSTFDEVVVRRILSGEQCKALWVDRWEVIRRLAERGYHDGQIAHVLDMHRTSVTRIRNRLKIPPAIPAISGRTYGPVSAPTRPKSKK